MPTRPKPLSEQVLVITGATSGIGLATARLAAARKAKGLVLVARNETALKALAAELETRGTPTAVAVADVGDAQALRAAASAAEQRFGGFDTWVNNAGVSIYGRIEDTPLEDQRRLFDTNYWGVVHGSRIAVEHLTARGGGTLINLGSVLSDFPVPLQGVYSASKHAVKGFTKALRMELLKDAPAVRVSLIKPSAIDTPYKEHAGNRMGEPGTNPPPVYAAPLVAAAILYAAETPVREITVGGGGRLLAILGQYAPALAEPLLAHVVPLLSKDRTGESRREADALRHPGQDLRERAPYRFVRESSLYTAAQMNPKVTAAVLGGTAAALWGVLKVRGWLKVARIRREVRAEYD